MGSRISFWEMTWLEQRWKGHREAAGSQGRSTGGRITGGVQGWGCVTGKTAVLEKIIGR